MKALINSLILVLGLSGGLASADCSPDGLSFFRNQYVPKMRAQHTKVDGYEQTMTIDAYMQRDQGKKDKDKYTVTREYRLKAANPSEFEGVSFGPIVSSKYPSSQRNGKNLYPSTSLFPGHLSQLAEGTFKNETNVYDPKNWNKLEVSENNFKIDGCVLDNGIWKYSLSPKDPSKKVKGLFTGEFWVDSDGLPLQIHEATPMVKDSMEVTDMKFTQLFQKAAGTNYVFPGEVHVEVKAWHGNHGETTIKYSAPVNLTESDKFANGSTTDNSQGRH